MMIIAECGINFTSIKMAKELIVQAKKCGADIAKFQLYEVDKLFPKGVIVNGKDWTKQVRKAQLSYEQGKELFNYCKGVGIEFMASAFDVERVGWLEDYGVKRHKIASPVHKMRDVCDYILDINKPILVSVPYGRVLYKRKNTLILYCIPEYPTPIEVVDFDLMQSFDGFSDHTVGIEAACIALSRGIKIIEKHFCLERDGSNPDMVCSITPDELERLVEWKRRFE